MSTLKVKKILFYYLKNGVFKKYMVSTLDNTISYLQKDIDSWYPEPEEKLSFCLSQGDADGSVTEAAVKQVFSKISSQKERGVTFKKEYICSTLRGGACSALAFNFIKNYIGRTEEHPFWRKKRVIKDISHEASQGARLEHRIQQAAFNCIAQDPSTQTSDFTRAKMQSLANFYDLRIIKASEEFKVSSEEHTSRVIDPLANGIYLVRMLLPSDNEKKEAFGHSMVYIQSDQSSFFYDPSRRVKELNDDNQSKQIHQFLMENHSNYGLKTARFYQVIPNNASSRQKFVLKSIKTIIKWFCQHNHKATAA